VTKLDVFPCNAVDGIGDSSATHAIFGGHLLRFDAAGGPITDVENSGFSKASLIQLTPSPNFFRILARVVTISCRDSSIAKGIKRIFHLITRSKVPRVAARRIGANEVPYQNIIWKRTIGQFVSNAMSERRAIFVADSTVAVTSCAQPRPTVIRPTNVDSLPKPFADRNAGILTRHRNLQCFGVGPGLFTAVSGLFRMPNFSGFTLR
jgi:hypothetical protein